MCGSGRAETACRAYSGSLSSTDADFGGGVGVGAVRRLTSRNLGRRTVSREEVDAAMDAFLDAFVPPDAGSVQADR